MQSQKASSWSRQKHYFASRGRRVTVPQQFQSKIVSVRCIRGWL